MIYEWAKSVRMACMEWRLGMGESRGHRYGEQQELLVVSSTSIQHERKSSRQHRPTLVK